MKSPDFNRFEMYNFRVLDPDSNELCKGLMNSKAWFKTVENSTLWEFIPENSRVIEKDLSPLQLELESTTLVDNTITLYLSGLAGAEEQDRVKVAAPDLLIKLEELLKERKENMPENSYTTHLFTKGEDKILKKLGEETVEVILAKGSRGETVYESADLLYHLLVHLVNKEIPFQEILNELARRMDN